MVFYTEYEIRPDSENADDNGRCLVAKASHVFNAAQVDGFVLPDAPESLGPIERLTRLARRQFIPAEYFSRAFRRSRHDHVPAD
jgi:hypothetical protein